MKPPEYQVDHGGGQDGHRGAAPVKKRKIIIRTPNFRLFILTNWSATGVNYRVNTIRLTKSRRG
jgi:hypothetical protein